MQEANHANRSFTNVEVGRDVSHQVSGVRSDSRSIKRPAKQSTHGVCIMAIPTQRADQLECDLIGNMTGWYVQWQDERGHHSSRACATQQQAERLAMDLGFTRWAVWEYEYHVKDVVIDKETLRK
jgi:hypothetical protein